MSSSRVDGRKGVGWAWAIGLMVMLGVPMPAWGERIIMFVNDPPVGDILPGTSFSVLAVLRGNNTPLAGYTLNVDVMGVPGQHVGDVTASIGLTNFYLDQNLIEQDPDDMLHPTFSMIGDPADGGVFINAISNSLHPVDLSIEGVSDVLAEIVFNVSINALGDFVISLGTGSSLGDEDFEDVPFTADALGIEVVPEPATAWVFGMFATLWVTTRRRFG